MRATREKVAIRQDLERCPLRMESRVMTVKGLYLLIRNKSQSKAYQNICVHKGVLRTGGNRLTGALRN